MTRRKLTVFIMLIFLTFLPAISFPGEVNLPQTGQKTCYGNLENATTDCSGTGQDGDIRAGVEWPTPRFKDNGNGTVTDQLTGLIWLKNANCAGPMTWDDALTYCNSLVSGSCGLSDGSVAGDWHCPNIIELESLTNAEELDSAAWLNTQGFSNVASHYYWSSTNHRPSNFGYSVDMGGGYNLVYDWAKHQTFYVWPVRGGVSAPAQTWRTGQSGSSITGADGDLQRGVSWPVPRFKDNSDGTVTDQLTGLVWLKKTDCAPKTFWSDALTFCNALASGSCGLTDGSVAGDWRLPNRKELLSLIDYSKSKLPTENPFDPGLSTSFWSSTTNKYNYFGYKWVVSTDNGNVYSTSHSNFLAVWPVREGQSGPIDPDPNPKPVTKTGPWIPLLLLDR